MDPRVNGMKQKQNSCMLPLLRRLLFSGYYLLPLNIVTRLNKHALRGHPKQLRGKPARDFIEARLPSHRLHNDEFFDFDYSSEGPYFKYLPEEILKK